MKTRKRRMTKTIEQRAEEYSKIHGIPWHIADRALWEKERNKRLTDKEAIARAIKSWKKFEIESKRIRKKRERDTP